MNDNIVHTVVFLAYRNHIRMQQQLNARLLQHFQRQRLIALPVNQRNHGVVVAAALLLHVAG